MSTYQKLINEIHEPNQLKNLRINLIKEIESITNRPLIVYASNFLKNVPIPLPNSIDESDIIGFSDLITNISDSNIDVIIHSPGGSAEATERIVSLLYQNFKSVRFIVPHSAYSAATLMVLSGESILMNEKSALGPIDQQVFDPFTGRFVPAQSILDGFEKARKVLEKEGPKAMPVYLPLLSKYDFTIFEICENAISFSKEIACKFLKEYMKVDKSKAEEIADFLCSHKEHLTHRRAIDISTAKRIGLKVIDLRENEKLNSSIWNLYCAIDLFFDRSNAVKLYENSQGISWSKNFSIQQPRPIQIELPIPSIPQSNPPEAK